MDTVAQRRRQRERNGSGRYTEYPKCHLCGKSCGTKYCSALLCDTDGWGDYGLVLHAHCCRKIDAMAPDAALALLKTTRGKS